MSVRTVAVGGFHSNFGTVTLLVIVGMSMLATNLPMFRRVPVTAAQTGPARRQSVLDDDRAVNKPLEDALWQMTPLAVMLSAMFLAGLFVGDFNWLYPVHIAVGAILLVHAWPRIAATFGERATWTAPVAGLTVYILWIVLVPRDPERAVLTMQTLAEAPLWAATGWILFRIVGSSLVVPILEELAFRGGLQLLLQHLLVPFSGPRFACAASLCLSSLAFGAMHGEFLAATIAGFVYGLVALQRGRVGDAIIAHGVTNFLIAAHVIVLGDWSLW